MAAVIVVLSVGLAVAMTQREKAIAASNDAESARLAEEALRRSVEDDAYEAKIFAAASAVQDNNIAAAQGFLRSASEKFRGWEWDRLNYVCHLDKKAIMVGHGELRDMTLSADSGSAVTIGSDGQVRVIDLESGRELRNFAATAGSPSCLALKGDVLAIGHQDGSVELGDLQGNLSVVYRHDKQVTDVAISPDGQRLASTGRDGFLRVRDLASGQNRGRDISAHRVAVAWFPDSRYVAVGGQSLGTQHGAGIYDASTIAEEQRFHRGLDAGVEIAVSADGERIVWEREVGRSLSSAAMANRSWRVSTLLPRYRALHSGRGQAS